MQTFKTDHDAVFWTADDGEWVPADVAQGLYDALNALVLSWDGDGVMILHAVDVARDALAAADGEEV